jgi:hypothetical protein
MGKSKLRICPKKLSGAPLGLILMIFFGIVIGGIYFSR